MPKLGERRCINPLCRRIIYDTLKVDELPDRIECQHCHRINVIRLKPLVPTTIEPEPSTEEFTLEPEPSPMEPSFTSESEPEPDLSQEKTAEEPE